MSRGGARFRSRRPHFFALFPAGQFVSLIPLLLSLVVLTATPAQAGSSNDYLPELIARARELKLADTREWHLLLHYRENLFGGYTSEQDGAEFFLAPDGKTDPQAELEATLTRFFSDELIGKAKQPVQCAFIGRYHWLNEMLSFDARRLPPQNCGQFEKWWKALDPGSITLIFPSAFMNNPASMFGHTFFRVDRKGQTPQTRLLAYTVNFAATVPQGEGVMFAVRGIAGGYRGTFSGLPYYLKVQEYRDIENRDIWEYRLNLTDGQVRRMLMHVWELGQAAFDYYFFKENCSYQLLPLLEVVNLDWRLTDQFTFWTIPGDSVRLLTSEPGLVGDIAYRPARTTQIRQRYRRLSNDERNWVTRIAEDAAQARAPAFTQLAVERQAFILDIVSDYLRYRGVKDEDRADLYKERDRSILIARSELRVKPDDAPIEPFITRPELGHKTSRAGIGAGYRHDEWFEEFNLRASYHDLLDPEGGYAPGYQISLLSGAIRHYEKTNQTRLDRFTLGNIMSLTPVDALFQIPSWKVNVGMETVRHNECRYCTAGVANGGAGLTVETNILKREYWFGFGELEATYGHAYERMYRAGGGGSAGVQGDLTDRWRVLATTTYMKYPLGEQGDEFRWSVGTRYTLARDLAMRFEYNHRAGDSQSLFTIQTYF